MNEHVLQKVTLTALDVYGGVPISFQSETRSRKIEVETVCRAVVVHVNDGTTEIMEEK